MTRYWVRHHILFVCLASLALLHLLWPTEANQQQSINGSLLDAFVARNIGPANVGGRIAAIAGVDGDPKTVYVGAASGGLWKTVDGGETWASIFDHQSSICIGDVAVSQSNPSVIWVGTGEHNARNSVTWGDGVYKSTDGGATWRHMGLKDSHTIGRIAIHPKNPDIVYVAVLGHLWGPNEERGIYKTTDGGKSWTISKFIDNDTGFVDLKMDPVEPDILYAAAYCVRRGAFSGGNPATFLGPGAGLYKTGDGGKNWEKMANGLPTNVCGRCGLDIYRKDSNVVYAVVQTEKTPTGNANEGGPPNGMTAIEGGGVFRSDDKGKTWSFLNTLVPRPFYYGQIRIDPNDDKRVYVLGASFFQSDDGGKTFSTGAKGGVHGDHHALWVNPRDSNVMWLGNDGGYYVSVDRAKSFRALRAAPLGQFYGISVDISKPYYVYGGMQDNGCWGGPSASHDPAGIRQSEWFRCLGGDGFHTQCDPTDANTVYVESQWGGLSRVNVATKGKGKGGGKGDGGGAGIAPKNLGARFNWSTPMLVSPHDPKTLYYGGHVLLMSTERGAAWKKISPNLTRGPDAGKSADYGHTLFTIGESPKKKGILWTGSDDGRIFVTKNGGSNWTDVSKIDAVPAERCISRVEPSHFNEAACYVSITRYRNDDRKPYIFKTTDYGETWKDITGDMPDNGSVHVVIESSRNQNLLFCGTEFGLFASLDGGNSWQAMKGGLPTAAVHDLVIHPRDRDLVVGTHGRSIFVIDDIGPLEQLTPEVLAKPGHLFDVRPVAALKTSTSTPAVKSNEFVGQNPPYGAIIRYHAKEGPVSLTVQDAAGKHVAKLKTADVGGLRQVVWNLRNDQGVAVQTGEYAAVLEVAGQRLVQRIRVEVGRP
jgi:photosystem II stability/assembly factor-like uncharacterized protein